MYTIGWIIFVSPKEYTINTITDFQEIDSRTILKPYCLSQRSHVCITQYAIVMIACFMEKGIKIAVDYYFK